MATDLIKNATANNTPLGWLLVGTINAWDALDGQAEGKFIEDDNSSSNQTNLFNGFDFSAIPVGSTINSVTLIYHSGRSAASPGQIRASIELVGVGTSTEAYHGPGGAGGTWQVNTWVVPRPTGGTWTRTEIAAANSLRMRFQGDGLGAAGVMLRVDYAEIKVNYTRPSGCLMMIG